MITTVIFDMDDTLYDEVEYCKSGFRAVAEFIENPPKTPAADHIFNAFQAQFTAGNHTKVFNTALEQLGISCDKEFIIKMVKVYRNHKPQITLPEDSRDVLEQLSKKYKLALLTDGFLPAQQLKVQALKIEKYFECIVYTEQLGREFWKPSPAGFEKIMKNLNAKPQTVVYVADNAKKDFIAPNKLGFFSIQLTRSAGIHTDPPPAPEAKPKHVINKITKLPELLEKL